MMRLQPLFSILLILGLICTGCASVPIAKPSLASRQKYIESNGSISFEIKQAMIEGKVIKGMTKEQVIATWGKPSEVLTWEASNSLVQGEESWWYNRYFNIFQPIFYINFKDGIVQYVEEIYK